jgi:hypothetical protein
MILQWQNKIRVSLYESIGGHVAATPENDFMGWALWYLPRKSGVSMTELPSSVLGLKIK